MTAHGADTHAQAVNGHCRRTKAFTAAQDLVGFDSALPLFLRLTITQILVDPGDQGARQGHAKVGRREGIVTHGAGDFAIDVENRGSGIVQQFLDGAVELAHLGQQLAHVLGTGTGRSLVGHGGRPLNQVTLEQATQGHQHQGHGAVAADPVTAPLGEGVLDNVEVDRIKDDHSLGVHPQRGGSVDPVTIPAGSAQLGVHLVGVITTLASDDDVHRLELIDVLGILQGRRFLAEVGCLAPRVGGGEEHRLDQCKVVLFAHALHQHGTNHATPANQTYSLHFDPRSDLMCFY